MLAAKRARLRVALAICFLPALAAVGDAAYNAPKSARKVYDTKADGKKQIAKALKQAKAEDKRVLLEFGANWCEWCVRLNRYFKEHKAVANVVKADYMLVLIDLDVVDQKKHNADVLEQYGEPTKAGLPALVVLDADGRQLTTKNTAELEEGDHYNEAKVLAWLQEWKPEKE
jgi:thiol:disulfide interchange protein